MRFREAILVDYRSTMTIKRDQCRVPRPPCDRLRKSSLRRARRRVCVCESGTLNRRPSCPKGIGFPWFIHARINIPNEGLPGDDIVPTLCIPAGGRGDNPGRCITGHGGKTREFLNEIRFALSRAATAVAATRLKSAKHSQMAYTYTHAGLRVVRALISRKMTPVTCRPPDCQELISLSCSSPPAPLFLPPSPAKRKRTTVVDGA